MANKILQNLDVDRPLRTWTSNITTDNVDKFYQMINKFNTKLYPEVIQKFV